MTPDEPTTVAIACQGGGSHTAFTAGVLETLLPELEARGYELVGLSGTSGGALCAVTAWYGLTTDGPEQAGELLEALWGDVAARSPAERMVNDATRWGQRLAESGLPMPQVSPYAIPGSSALEWFRERLDAHVDVEQFAALADEDAPQLIVGAVDVTQGSFETFGATDLTTDAVIASAAVPSIFEAVEVGGSFYWDGLFSQNPPVRDFLTGSGPKPDEIWVVQINPQRREAVPESMGEIADRRNELSGNLSLNQELEFIETVNEWVAAGYLPDEYKPVEVRRLSLDRDLSSATKLDRDPEFIESLLADGRAAAEEFLTAQS